MKTIQLKTKTAQSTIYCGEGVFEKYVENLGEDLFVVTDTNVYKIYSELIKKSFKGAPCYILTAGESSKSYSQLIYILQKMANSNLTRKSTLIAFGGGVVGDIGGLAAALYMRGINVVQIPTTLLAQVDSSVGGKTAVDMGKVKNAIGTFYQPRTVIVDPVFLRTLPIRELRCGMGEIVKYAGISSKIFDKLYKAENPYDWEFIEEITYDCIAHKASVVERDEKDVSGVRKSLNLGHTVGHTLELYYGGLSHGEYVAIGMYYELEIAKELGICHNYHAKRMQKLIGSVVTQIPCFKNIKKAAKLSSHDKKNDKPNKISIIAPIKRGRYCELKIDIKDYCNFLENINSRLSKEQKPIKLCVIGKDVSASQSPKMHSFISEKLGYKIEYDKLSVDSENFDNLCENCLKDYFAFNVTIPYKLSVIPHLKYITGDALSFHSVNTVCRFDKSGYNTDGVGFMLMLENNKVSVGGKSVLLLGAGGAGRSVSKKLIESGANVYVYDKNFDSAREVASQTDGVTALSQIENKSYDIIINATGVGMHNTVGISPVGEGLIDLCKVAIDLIYVPPKSKFLELAENLGKKIINGEAMLFYQAYYAECIFFGVECRAEQAKKLFEEYKEKVK